MSVSPPTGRRHEMNCPGRNAIRGPRRKSERVSGACSTMRATRAACSTAMLRHDLVDGVAGDDDHNLGVGILHHRLAAEAGGGGEARGLVEQVVLALVGRGEHVAAALHDHVARGAGAVPAAGMLEVDAVPEHFAQLADRWVRFRDDAAAYVAILTGVGDVYCVGADLKSFIPIVTERADKLREGESKLPQEGSRYTMAHSLVAVLRDGATLPDGSEFTLYKPVIAAINGICAAGGLEMMWNTDLRVCADTAWFQLAEPRRGLFPGGGSTVQSVRQLTWCHAMEVLLLADRIPAARAYDMGLVNRVVPRERVVDEARAIADTICLNGPLAVRACKQSAKESTFLPLREALANESRYSATVFMSDDAKEGLAAFREKRAPVWRGR